MILGDVLFCNMPGKLGSPSSGFFCGALGSPVFGGAAGLFSGCTGLGRLSLSLFCKIRVETLAGGGTFVATIFGDTLGLPPEACNTLAMVSEAIVRAVPTVISLTLLPFWNVPGSFIAGTDMEAAEAIGELEDAPMEALWLGLDVIDLTTFARLLRAVVAEAVEAVEEGVLADTIVEGVVLEDTGVVAVVLVDTLVVEAVVLADTVVVFFGEEVDWGLAGVVVKVVCLRDGGLFRDVELEPAEEDFISSNFACTYNQNK